MGKTLCIQSEQIEASLRNVLFRELSAGFSNITLQLYRILYYYKHLHIQALSLLSLTTIQRSTQGFLLLFTKAQKGCCLTPLRSSG